MRPDLTPKAPLQGDGARGRPLRDLRRQEERRIEAESPRDSASSTRRKVPFLQALQTISARLMSCPFQCRRHLIAVVGVDVEAENRVDFYGLSAAGGGAEFPAGQGGHDFCGHGGGAGFEDLEIFQVAAGV